MAIAGWPNVQDDSGVGNDGSLFNAAYNAAVQAAVEAQIEGTDNPLVRATDLIDEVVLARGIYSALDDRLDSLVAGQVGIVNPGVTAAAVIDEVVAARNAYIDLDTRLENLADATDIQAASVSLAGKVTSGTQTFGGDKTFAAALLKILGIGSAVGRVAAGMFASDFVQRSTSGTGATVLSTLTLPANSLNADNDAIEFTILYKPAANANAKTVTIDVMGTAVTLVSASTQNAGQFVIRGAIWRVSSTSARVFGTVNGTAVIAPFDTTISSGVDWTASSSLITKGTTATAGVSTQDFLTVAGLLD